jgi:predicted RNase H-like HicB family nuclease
LNRLALQFGQTALYSVMEITTLLQASTFSLTAIMHWEEDVYVAECPEVGTASQGETIEEALTNLREATELYLEEFPMPHMARRLITTFEVANAQATAS